MIYGYCMGGAMGVAMACDLRFAAEGSKFGIPAARLSIIYPPDAIGQLVDLVGPAYAKDILFSARTVSDREALAIGFIQRLVPAGDLEQATHDYLATLADNAPLSVRQAKKSIRYGMQTDLLTGYRFEIEAYNRLVDTEDRREGVRAFNEKRKPTFQGR